MLVKEFLFYSTYVLNEELESLKSRVSEIRVKQRSWYISEICVKLYAHHWIFVTSSKRGQVEKKSIGMLKDRT